MGTRNLTMVICDGQTKVAQYGQWDGYPEGQGETARAFLASADLLAFRKKLASCRFVTQEEVAAAWEQAGAKKDQQFVGMDVSARFDKILPYLSRDHGAEILAAILDSDGEVALRDESSFAADGLFCEWAYVIDFDKGAFEVYDGFHKEPPAAGQRFADLPKHKEDYAYFPVHLVASFPLDSIPAAGAFLEAIKAARPDDDAEAA